MQHGTSIQIAYFAPFQLKGPQKFANGQMVDGNNISEYSYHILEETLELLALAGF